MFQTTSLGTGTFVVVWRDALAGTYVNRTHPRRFARLATVLRTAGPTGAHPFPSVAVFYQTEYAAAAKRTKAAHLAWGHFDFEDDFSGAGIFQSFGTQNPPSQKNHRAGRPTKAANKAPSQKDCSSAEPRKRPIYYVLPAGVDHDRFFVKMASRLPALIIVLGGYRLNVVDRPVSCRAAMQKPLAQRPQTAGLLVEHRKAHGIQVLQDADGPFARHAQGFAQHTRGGGATGSLDSR